MDFQKVNDDVKLEFINSLVSVLGISSAWKLRGVCRLFREEIRRNIFLCQPQSSFHCDTSRRLMMTRSLSTRQKTPGCQALVLRFMPYFLQAKVTNPGGFNPSLPNAITQMFNYVARPLGPGNSYSLLGLDVAYRREEIIAHICKSICCILGNEKVLSALFTDIPPSSLVKRLDPAWFAALNGNFDVHSKVTAAIAAGCAKHVGLLVWQLPPDSSAHAVFGSPLVNAIKLKDSVTARELIRYIWCFDSTDSQSIFEKPNQDTAFPVYQGVKAAIEYSQAEILLDLGELIHHKIGEVDSDCFNSWIIEVVRNSNIEVLQSLYQIPVESTWLLSRQAMFELLSTTNYELIHFAFVNAKYNNNYRRSGMNTFHLAVINGIEAAKAVYDTGNHDVNHGGGVCDLDIRWKEKATALDYAIHQKDPVTVKWLLDQGAEYRGSFTPKWLSGWIYNLIRDQAIKNDPRMSNLPSFGQYKEMNNEAKLFFTFDLVE